jgi:hypothetical protein
MVQFSAESELNTVPSPSRANMGSLLPGLIFFTSWLEHIKILLTMLQNSLHQIQPTNEYISYSATGKRIICEVMMKIFQGH